MEMMSEGATGDLAELTESERDFRLKGRPFDDVDDADVGLKERLQYVFILVTFFFAF